MGTAIDGDTAADVEEGRRKQQSPQNNEDDANSARHIVSFSPNGEDDGSSTIPPQPLYHSTRLKGYIVLFVSALYNFMAAADAGYVGISSNLCLEMDHLGSFADNIYTNESKLRYAESVSLITIIITGLIILCHFDLCTPLRKNVWPKVFGKGTLIELWILIFLSIFWCVTTWFNTSIRGPAGEGKEQYNLYFSSWICLWSSIWTLERWCTATNRASFGAFIRSWPNRCPMWIVTFLLSLMDFMFVLDTYRNWEEGSRTSPFLIKLYTDVKQAEWTLLFFVTCLTFMTSLVWCLAEIFRENVTNVDNVKSDVEFFVEQVIIHCIALLWIVTVCISTMPGGAASLLGNLYFTTWLTLFAVIGTLLWAVKDWRGMINGRIKEKQDEYEYIKTALRKREEDRRARLAEQRGKDKIGATTSQSEDENESSEKEEEKEEEDSVLCEDDPKVDDDITISVSSEQGTTVWRGPSAITTGSVKYDNSGVTASYNLFASALSYLYSGTEDDDQQ